MQRLYQYLTILLTISIFLTVYFMDSAHNSAEDISIEPSVVLGKFVNSSDTSLHPWRPSRTNSVVAYSFLKQIENENVEVDCPNLMENNETVSEYVEGLKPLCNGEWKSIRNTSTLVYAAYPDHRVKSFVYIRFIAMLKDGWTDTTLYCQFHFNAVIKVIRASRTSIWSKNWKNPDRMTPVLYSCPLNKRSEASSFNSVTLSTVACEVGDFRLKFNNSELRTTKEVPSERRLRLMVCVKPLNFPSTEDIFDKLLTWLEMNVLLGVERFDVYVNSASKKVMKLLKWYRAVRKSINILTYVNPTFASDALHVNKVTAIWRKRKNELIAYNDCLYRNIHRTDFVIPLDIDEIIVPKIHATYQDLLASLSASHKFSCISVRNAFFFHKTANYSIFDTTFRTRFSTPYRSGKSFVNTSATLTVFNHYSLQALYPGVSKTFVLDDSLAQLNHYRAGCDSKLLPDDCNMVMTSSPVFDDNVSRFKEQFLERYLDVNRRLEAADSTL